MYKPSKGAGLGLSILAVLALLAAASVLIGYRWSESRIARDFEECAEEAQTQAASNTEYSNLVKHCGERFAGRRKPGGGYTYFDFMQNRTFDIAGPNPTEDERRQIDRAYMEFLGAQRREMLSSEAAKRQADQAALERSGQDAGAPLALTPKVPLPVKRPLVERSRPCEDGSLSCGWAKLSAAVKNAFASSAGSNR
jgi:hypothetical protein